MKKTILRYTIYSSIAELIFFFLTWLVIGLFNLGHVVQGYISYVSIICPLLFVYFGIRYYRDHVNNGSITFLNAIKTGLLIVILPTISFAIIETVYVLYLDPNFYKNVAAYDIEQYRKTLSAAQFAAKLKEINEHIKADNNPIYNFFNMIALIGCTGILITLISSLLLMKKSAVSGQKA
jgi:hypothetical protein